MSARKEIAWSKALDDYEEAIADFTERGYSRDTALLSLLLNRMYGELLDIEELLVEEVPEDGPDKESWER